MNSKLVFIMTNMNSSITLIKFSLFNFLTARNIPAKSIYICVREEKVEVQLNVENCSKKHVDNEGMKS
jgi:hypothetical protein